MFCFIVRRTTKKSAPFIPITTSSSESVELVITKVTNNLYTIVPEDRKEGSEEKTPEHIEFK